MNLKENHAENQDVGKRFKAFVNTLNVTDTRLCEMLDIDMEILQSVYVGEFALNTVINQWAYTQGVNMDWLIKGEGEMFREKERAAKVRYTNTMKQIYINQKRDDFFKTFKK